MAMLAVWLLRERIAIWLFGDATRATEVGLIGIAILLALLAPRKRSLAGTAQDCDSGACDGDWGLRWHLAGLAAVWLQGESGLIWFILRAATWLQF